MAGGVKQRGGQFHFERFGPLHQVDQRRLIDGHIAEQIGGGLGELGTGLDFVIIRLSILDQRGRGAHLAGEPLGSIGSQGGIGGLEFAGKSRGLLRIHIPRRSRSSLAQPGAQVAHLGGGVGKQPRYLGLERASADDLAQGGIGGQRQQVAREIEGAGLQRALVALGLQSLRALDAPAQRIEHRAAGLAVGFKQTFDC